MFWCGRQLATGPTAEPINLAKAKEHCRVDGESDDSYMESLVSVAREHIESITGRAMMPQTWRAYYPEWGEFWIPSAPVSSITHIKYYPADGSAAVTVVSSTYHLVSSREPNRIVLAYSKEWPMVDMRTIDPIEIQFACGYASSAAIPARLIHAMKMLIAHWYSKREVVVIGNPTAIDSKELAFAVSALCADYRLRFPL